MNIRGLHCKYQIKLLSIVLADFFYMFRTVSNFLLHLTFTMCHRKKVRTPFDSCAIYTDKVFLCKISHVCCCYVMYVVGAAVVRALTFHQCGAGSIPGLGVMWIEFVVGSHPCSEGFSPGTPVFLGPQKPRFPNSNLTWKQWSKSHSMDSTEIPIYFILFYLCYVYYHFIFL